MLNTCAQLFVDDLKAKNLNFNSGVDGDGDSVVEFPYQGKIAKMFFSGDDGCYFSLYVVYERVPENKLPDALLACNEMNCRFKWVTFYLDRDNDIVMHDDAILSPANAAEEAFELLVRILKIGDQVKPELMKIIYA